MRDFNSFAAFAKHLLALAELSKSVDHEMLKRGAEIIQKDAQDRLGHYQMETGPFAAWSELADSTKADRVAKGFTENDPEYRTGYLHDSIVSGVEGDIGFAASEDPVALWQDQGTDDGHIPPRSIFGAAGFASCKKITVLYGNMTLAWISGTGWRKPAKRISGPLESGE